MLLTTTSDKIQVLNSAAGDIDIFAFWTDLNGTTVTTDRKTTPGVGTATTTDAVLAPAASTQRKVKYFSVHNESTTVAQTVEVYHFDGTNSNELHRATLGPLETIIYSEGGGWQKVNAAGANVNTGEAAEVGSQALLARTNPTLRSGVDRPLHHQQRVKVEQPDLNHMCKGSRDGRT